MLSIDGLDLTRPTQDGKQLMFLEYACSYLHPSREIKKSNYEDKENLTWKNKVVLPHVAFKI